MFDEQQKADAMGCIYKMEFLRGILDVKDPKAYSDKEFNALVVVRTYYFGLLNYGPLNFGPL